MASESPTTPSPTTGRPVINPVMHHVNLKTRPAAGADRLVRARSWE